MKILILCLFITSVYSTIPGEYTVKFFDQKVDHFTYKNDFTFSQRVVISKKNAEKINPPIFFYAGNEGDIFAFVNNTGFMWEIQDEFDAVLVFAEHRYYGKSFPPRKSKTDYEYLTIDQAMADFAHLIDMIKANHKNYKNSPVIMFGGSYGGMLASWFKLKYPHLVEGSIASSAPISQFEPIYECTLFNNIVTKDYENYSLDCGKAIRKVWPTIRKLTKNEEQRLKLSKVLSLCKPLKNEDEVNQLINFFADVITNMAMTDYPNPASFLKPMPRYPIKETCKILRKDLNDYELMENFKDGLSIYFNYTGELDCISYKDDSTDLGAEGWYYQACTEAIMPVCATGKEDFFEKHDWDLEEIKRDCKAKYNVTPDTYKVRQQYSLQDLRAYKNIVLSNGDRDPWSVGGVTIDNYKNFALHKVSSETFFEDTYVDKKLIDTPNVIFTNGPILINIPTACHHEDLRVTEKYDSIDLINTRKLEAVIIRKWIEDYKKIFH